MVTGSDFENDDAITGINVTPLVDVMLVLLVIFMVTANYIAHQALSLELPKAVSGEDPGATNLNLVLDKNSDLFIEGRKISFTELAPIINQEVENKSEVQALISADRATPHGSVIKLMDIIKKSGIREIAFNVEFDIEEKTK